MAGAKLLLRPDNRLLDQRYALVGLIDALAVDPWIASRRARLCQFCEMLLAYNGSPRMNELLRKCSQLASSFRALGNGSGGHELVDTSAPKDRLARRAGAVRGWFRQLRVGEDPVDVGELRLLPLNRKCSAYSGLLVFPPLCTLEVVLCSNESRFQACALVLESTHLVEIGGRGL